MTTSEREKKIYHVTLVGSAVNIVLIALKFIAGVVGRSAAMTADAIHSLSDLVTDIIVIVFIRISGKPGDSDHGYGHGKFETMATLIVGLILLFVGLGVAYSGITSVIASLKGHTPQPPGMLALIVAVVSIVLKEWVYRFTVSRGRSLDSPAVIANAWHHRSDAFSSIGTLAGIAGAMFLGERWRILDPVAAVIVSWFIIKTGYDIIRPCIDELLEKSLPPETEHEIANLIKSVPGVVGIHRLRTRRIGHNIAIEVHTKMDGDKSLRHAHDVASVVERRVKERYGADTHIGIHMEPDDDIPATNEG